MASLIEIMEKLRRNVAPEQGDNHVAKVASSSAWDENDAFDLESGDDVTKPANVIVSCSETFWIRLNNTAGVWAGAAGVLLKADDGHVFPTYGRKYLHYKASTGTPNVTVTVEGD